MKKIYVLLLLTTNVLSPLCMEKQRSKWHDKNNTLDIPLTVINQTPPRQGFKGNAQPNATAVCTANEPGWEKYDEIMNITYKNNQPVIINPTDLTTVYRPDNNNAAQEKKPFLRTITPVPPDANIMEKLYKSLYNDTKTLVDHYNNTYCTDTLAKDKRLILLIQNLRDAKKIYINEDIMGKFAYNYWYGTTYFPDITGVCKYISLFFGCLKQYTLTTNNTKEKLPSDNDIRMIIQATPTVDNKLAKTLGITTETENRAKETLLLNFKIKHSAYYKLTEGLMYLILRQEAIATTLQEKIVRIFASCLHSDEKIILEDYSDGSYKNLKDDVFSIIFWALFNIGEYNVRNNRIYKVLKIIERAKISNDMTHEKNLGYDILELKPKLFFDYSSKAKNYISLFCILVEKYNLERGNKITPTVTQYYCYNLKNNISLALPDSFNSSPFNPDHYALKEFDQLLDDIAFLMKSDAAIVQQFVNQLYPPRK